MIGYSPVVPNAIVRIEVESRKVDIVKIASELPVDKGYLSEPIKITFPTGKDLKSEAHGYLYMPEVRKQNLCSVGFAG